jgi:hypothetical protein
VFVVVRSTSAFAQQTVISNREKKNTKELLLKTIQHLSTSSRKTTQGLIFEASVNIACAYFSPSPNHLLPIDATDTFIKFARPSVATALASIVLPVPGGPNNNTVYKQ